MVVANHGGVRLFPELCRGAGESGAPEAKIRQNMEVVGRSTASSMDGRPRRSPDLYQQIERDGSA